MAPTRVKRKTAHKKTQKDTPAEKLVSSIRKKFKKLDQDAVVALGDQPVLADVQEWSTTGIPTIDVIASSRYGGLGLGVGRAYEYYGKEKSAKTALADFCGAQWQATFSDGIVVKLDYENSHDTKQVLGYGYDMDRFIYANVESLEDGIDLVEYVMTLGAPVLFIWDSVAAAPPDEELKKTAGESTVGLQARLYSKFCRKIARPLSKTRCSIIFVNQVRTKIGGFTSRFGDPYTRSGGLGLDFACSLMLKFARVKTVKKKKTIKGVEHTIVKGYWIEVEAFKSRLGRPHVKGLFFLNFSGENAGPDPRITTYRYLKDHGLLKKVTRDGEEQVCIVLPEGDLTFPQVEWPAIYRENRATLTAAVKDHMLESQVEEDYGYE